MLLIPNVPVDFLDLCSRPQPESMFAQWWLGFAPSVRHHTDPSKGHSRLAVLGQPASAPELQPGRGLTVFFQAFRIDEGLETAQGS